MTDGGAIFRLGPPQARIQVRTSYIDALLSLDSADLSAVEGIVRFDCVIFRK
jgi:hypothetical protein